MKRKILIIEDEELMLMLLKQRMLKENFDVDLAKDGNEAIACIDKVKYDSILMDLMLPFVSGFQLIAHVRESSNNAQTPIIVLSALSSEKSVLEAFSIGANDFFKKPFAINILIAKLKLQAANQRLLPST